MRIAELGVPPASERCAGIDRGDYAQAKAAATRAAELGGRFDDADLFALGVHFQRTLCSLSPMISVVTGEVWHPVAGNVYCSMIDVCLEISEWVMERWCLICDAASACTGPITKTASRSASGAHSRCDRSSNGCPASICGHVV